MGRVKHLMRQTGDKLMKSNRYEMIGEIQHNAANPVNDNVVVKDITYQQALSILIRNEQLRYEGQTRTRAIVAEKKRQIEKCWETRRPAIES